MKEMIKITHLKKEINKILLDNFSLSLPDRGLICITGDSKESIRTLLNIIGAMDKPTLGEVSFYNQEINYNNEKQLEIHRKLNIDFCCKEELIFEDLTVK